MSDNSSVDETLAPAQIDIERMGTYEEIMPGEGSGAGVSALERDIMSFFDENEITYKNEWAANTVGGYTFADYDHDGWYDHLEQTTQYGTRLYCGNGVWNWL